MQGAQVGDGWRYTAFDNSIVHVGVCLAGQRRIVGQPVDLDAIRCVPNVRKLHGGTSELLFVSHANLNRVGTAGDTRSWVLDVRARASNAEEVSARRAGNAR